MDPPRYFTSMYQDVVLIQKSLDQSIHRLASLELPFGIIPSYTPPPFSDTPKSYRLGPGAHSVRDILPFQPEDQTESGVG